MHSERVGGGVHVREPSLALSPMNNARGPGPLFMLRHEAKGLSALFMPADALQRHHLDAPRCGEGLEGGVLLNNNGG